MNPDFNNAIVASSHWTMTPKLVDRTRFELADLEDLRLNTPAQNWWTDRESNPDYPRARGTCSHYHYQPEWLG